MSTTTPCLILPITSHKAVMSLSRNGRRRKPAVRIKKMGQQILGQKGKRQDFEPRTPRVPTAVEPPMQAALRTLLHHPELAEKVENASHFAAEDQSNAQLLVALIEARQRIRTFGRYS